MNRPRLLSVLACLTIALAARAAETSPRACCAAEPAAAPAGAGKSARAAEPPAAPFSARSIYQLGATWTNDAGRPVTLATLRGEPVVLAMFFASCEYACPLIVNDLERIRAALPAAVRARTRFVLVSFDAARDTPAALRAYRTRMHLEDPAWTLLHGGPDDVQELAMLLGVKYRRDARGQFAHSNLITVLDTQGVIVHQRTGLQGDVAGTARAVSRAAK